MNKIWNIRNIKGFVTTWYFNVIIYDFVSTLGERDRIWNIRNIKVVGGRGGVKIE